VGLFYNGPEYHTGWRDDQAELIWVAGYIPYTPTETTEPNCRARSNHSDDNNKKLGYIRNILLLSQQRERLS